MYLSYNLASTQISTAVKHRLFLLPPIILQYEIYPFLLILPSDEQSIVELTSLDKSRLNLTPKIQDSFQY